MALNNTLGALAILLAVSACATAGDHAVSSKAANNPLNGLEYRLLGPAVNGRITRVGGVPGDPKTFYASAAQGGVWKSVDGGHAWEPIFDAQDTQSVGSSRRMKKSW